MRSLATRRDWQKDRRFTPTFQVTDVTNADHVTTFKEALALEIIYDLLVLNSTIHLFTFV